MNWKDWKVQLVSPLGEVVASDSMGYASACMAHSYIMPEIVSFLQGSTLTQRELILADPYQMLLNSGFHGWHGYRLVWGDATVDHEFAAYPNKGDLKWALYRLINNEVKKLVEGELPSDWYDIDDEDKLALINERVLQCLRTLRDSL